MKFIPLILISLLGHAALAQAPSKPVDSKIVKVTVFPEGAQVTRTGRASVPPGRTELVFGGISPYADGASIQVAATGAFTILSVSPQPNKLKEQKKRKEIEEIERSKEGFNKQLIREEATLDVYTKEEQMLEANSKIGGANTGLKAADLSAALDLHRTRLMELKLFEIEYDAKIKKIQDTLALIDQQINVLNQTQDLEPASGAGGLF